MSNRDSLEGFIINGAYYLSGARKDLWATPVEAEAEFRNIVREIIERSGPNGRTSTGFGSFTCSRATIEGVTEWELSRNLLSYTTETDHEGYLYDWVDSSSNTPYSD